MTIVKCIKEQTEYLKTLTPGTSKYNQVENEIRNADDKLIALSLDPRNDLKSA